MKVYETSMIRNVSLLGHRGSGKTTLVEAILHSKDVIKRWGVLNKEQLFLTLIKKKKEDYFLSILL